MALPKKGSRTITVDGVRYRYRGYATHMKGDDYGELIAELAESPGEKIRALFSWTKLSLEYRKVGHALSHASDRVPPYVARQCILHALSLGWVPAAGGGLRDLGDLDEVLDFSGLHTDPIGEKRLGEQLHAKLLGHLRARVGRHNSPPGITLEVLQATRNDAQTLAHVLYDYRVHCPTLSGSDTDDHIVVFAIATLRGDLVDVETKIRETLSIHERHWGDYDRLKLCNAVRTRAMGLMR